MNWTKRIGALALIALLTFTPLTSAWAVEDEAADETTVEQTDDTAADETDGEDVSEEEEPADEEDADSDEDGEESDGEDTDDGEKTEETPKKEKKEKEEPDLDPVINLSAGASICVNAETGEIIHEKNAKEKMYPASTTKIMTALLVLENCEDLSETVTMVKDDFADVANGASSAGLQLGETVTVEDLLYCMLLPSGNEAANALARYIGGDVASFAEMMNDCADKLGFVNTHFVNPNGLHDDDHYTCAYDLYLIAQAAMQFESFQTIVNTAQKKLSATNLQEERIVYTTNELILSRWSPQYYDYCYGIKTGHTTPAGYCLVSFANNKDVGLSYYSVVLGCPFDDEAAAAGSFVETKKLFQWAFSKYSMKTAAVSGDAITERKVRLGKDKDAVTLVTSEDVSVLIPRDADVSMLDVTVEAEDSYDAPIAAGDKLGTVTYSYHGKELASTDLVALTGIERSQLLFFLDQFKNFLLSRTFRIIAAVVVILLVVLLLVRAFFRRRRKRRRKLRQNKNRRRR